jgi:hypothetical protein
LLMKFHGAIGRKSMLVTPNEFENHEFHHVKRALSPHLS